MHMEPELGQDGVIPPAELSSQRHFCSSATGFMMHLQVQKGIIFTHLLFGLSNFLMLNGYTTMLAWSLSFRLECQVNNDECGQRGESTDIIRQSAADRPRWGSTGLSAVPLTVLPCGVLAVHRHRSGYVSLIQGLPSTLEPRQLPTASFFHSLLE